MPEQTQTLMPDLAATKTLDSSRLGHEEQGGLSDTISASQAGPSGAGNFARKIGRYLIIEQVGAGAMGAVFAAFDPELDRRIALKLLHAQHNFAQAEERLLREAQALAKLSHPNIVAVYDVGHHGSQVFMAMEFVRGQTLGSWIREHRGGPIQPILDMLTMVGRGLAAAHASGMVHRDFKPENVLVGEDGRPRVVDFGLVALRPEAHHLPARSVSQLDLTATGAVMGTPAYMAPEQFLGATADARSDQFAYCVVLYESLYGHRPFAGDTFPVLSANVLAGRHRGFSRSQRHPRRLAQLIARGLAPKPENRWPSMDELLRELSRESPWKRARNIAGISLAVGGALAIGIVGPWNQDAGACPDRARPFANIWTPEIAGAVTASIQQTGVAYAATSASRITTQLGHYQDQWTSVYQSTCDALDAEPLASNRVAQLACLDQRRREFSATVAVLHHADEELIAEATNAVAMLSPPEQCLDPRRASSFPKLPRDPTRAAAIIRLRGKLAEIDFLWRTASFTKARTKLNEVEPSVVEVNDVFLTFETQIIRAELLGRSRQLDKATQLLTQVWRDALATNHDGIALTARLITAELNSARASAFPQTFAILEDVHALILRLGYDSPKGEVYARYLISLGHALERVSKRTEARPHLERALALVESLYPEGHPLATKVLSRIAILEMGSGNGALALEYGRSVVVRHEAALAPNHPQVAGALNNFAVIAREAKAFDEAINAQERAIRIWLVNREDPRVDANVAMGYQNLAKTYLKIGDYEQARKAYRAELELRRKLEGERSWAVADLYANVASSYITDRRYEEAKVELDAAAASSPAVDGSQREVYTNARIQRVFARYEIQTGAYHLAIERLEQSLARELDINEDGRFLASTESHLATALWEEGRHTEASEVAKRGLAHARSDSRGFQIQAALEKWLKEHHISGS